MTKHEGGPYPVALNPHAWYYENPRSLTVVVEAQAHDGHVIATTQVKILARKLEASLRRMAKRKR